MLKKSIENIVEQANIDKKQTNKQKGKKKGKGQKVIYVVCANFKSLSSCFAH